MKILYDSDLISRLGDLCYLFLDTTSFVTAFKYEADFGGLLKKLKDNHCALLTIPSVDFEFTRGSSSIEVFNKRREFVGSLADIYPIEKALDGLESLMVVLQKVAGGMSYTDFLLSACLYRFPNAYLLTENHKDFPAAVFERSYIITIDTGEEIRNHGIYRLSRENLNKAASNILKDQVIS